MKYKPQKISHPLAIENAKNNTSPEGLYYYLTPYGSGNWWIAIAQIKHIRNWCAVNSEQECIDWLQQELIRLNKLINL